MILGVNVSYCFFLVLAGAGCPGELAVEQLVLTVCKLQIGITASQLACFADITANISLCIRSYYLITWMSTTAAVPASSVTL